MADLAGITAVRPTSNTQLNTSVLYGATVSAGQPVYLDSTDNEHKLADASASTTAAAVGVAITPGVDAGYGLLATGGNIILVGTTMTVGQVYCVSATSGGIAPESDILSTEYVTILGTAVSATELKLNIDATGIAHA